MTTKVCLSLAFILLFVAIFPSNSHLLLVYLREELIGFERIDKHVAILKSLDLVSYSSMQMWLGWIFRVTDSTSGDIDIAESSCLDLPIEGNIYSAFGGAPN